MTDPHRLRVGAYQGAPVFLDRRGTTETVLNAIDAARDAGVSVLGFGETFLPGYPFWLSSTGGARFNDPAQKEAFAAYLDAAVTADGPELSEISARARDRGVYVVLGAAERGQGVATGSTYATLFSIHPQRGIVSAHRKLVPTYEERLVWAHGDGQGLRAHDFAGTRVSALNCWENWMPQARHAMYADGTRLHVASWPGSVQLTRDVTRMVAMEGRVFVLSAGAYLAREDIPSGFPLVDAIPAELEVFQDGGSCVAGPDGAWILEPKTGRLGLVTAEIDLGRVDRERQNFDPTGHYSRPDIFQVSVDRRRRRAANFTDDPGEA